MPFDPIDMLERLEFSVGLLPPTILAILLLTGPTVAWLLYRLVAQPRSRRAALRMTGLLWICERCQSASEARLSRCYRCGHVREETVGDLQVLDGDGLVTLGRSDTWLADPMVPGDALPAATRPAPVAVGPGRIHPDRQFSDVDRRAVAVGPGAPIPVRPRKAVASGRRDTQPSGPPPGA